MSIFFSSKCRLFHNATLFGFCITHILNTGCAKIWKKKIRNQKVNDLGGIGEWADGLLLTEWLCRVFQLSAFCLLADN